MSNPYDPSSWSPQALDRLYRDIERAPDIDLADPSDLSNQSEHPSHGPHRHGVVPFPHAWPDAPSPEQHAADRLRRRRQWRDTLNPTGRRSRRVRPTLGSVVLALLAGFTIGYLLHSYLINQGATWTP